jgi:hypothetical protein
MSNTFNEKQLRSIGEAVKTHFTEEKEADERILDTVAGLSESDHELLIAATAPPRTYPKKSSWLGSPQEMAAALGAELEEYEPNRTTEGSK